MSNAIQTVDFGTVTCPENVRAITVDGKGQKLMRPAQFVAAKLNVKLVKGMKMKDIIQGKDKAVVKKIRNDYDAGRREWYRFSGTMVALASADPSIRKNIRVVTNKTGQAIGFNAAFRRETDSSSMAAQLQAVLAELAALKAAQPKPAIEA